MGRRFRESLAVAAIVLLAATSAFADARVAAGTYTRNVTSDQLQRAGSAAPHGTWTLRIKAKGLSLEARGQGLVPERAAWAGSRVTISDTPGAVSLFCGPAVKGIYAWTQTGSRITFKLVQDGCKDRAGVLIGGWRKSAR